LTISVSPVFSYLFPVHRVPHSERTVI
jgi:hypothetical protein